MNGIHEVEGSNPFGSTNDPLSTLIFDKIKIDLYAMQ